MEIEHDGIVAKQERYKYAVKANNKSNIIIFKFSKQQDSIVLDPNKHFYVKVQNSGKTFTDKDPNVVVTSDTKNVFISWIMLRKVTAYKNIDVQVQYEDADEDIVWQSAIVNIDLFQTIPADKEIEDKYPSILMAHQQKLDELERRIKALEDAPAPTHVWGGITGDIHDQTDLMEIISDINSAINTEIQQRQDAISLLSGKLKNEKTERQLEDARLAELIANIEVAWGKITGNIESQLDLKEKLDVILAIAQGNTKSFSVDTDVEGNEIFKSDDIDIEVEQFTDIDGNVIQTSSLKNGDLIFTKNTSTTTYQDRWLLDKTNNIWSILSADDPRLENYFTKTEINALLALKADLESVYTRQQADQKFAKKEDLENKADLVNDKVPNTQLPIIGGGTNASAGLVGFSSVYGTYSAPGFGGLLVGVVKTLEEYLSGNDRMFISKGTLENVLTQLRNAVPNIINASDITNNKLTQEQYDLITTSKKMTLIKGALLGDNDLILFPPYKYDSNTNSYRGIYFASNTSPKVYLYNIHGETKIISHSSAKYIQLDNINKINEFNVPTKPTDLTKQYKFVIKQTTGNVALVEDTGGGIEFNPSSYIIQQGSAFVSVDALPEEYTGVAYQFSTNGLITTSYINGVLQHTILQNANTGKVLIDNTEETMSFDMVDGTSKTINLVVNK